MSTYIDKINICNYLFSLILAIKQVILFETPCMHFLKLGHIKFGAFCMLGISYGVNLSIDYTIEYFNF